MTYQEAIKNINALNAICGQKDFYGAELEKSLALAIDALEKQIPKKPKKTDRADILSCFNCGFLFGIDTYKFLRCCPKCGQALDWSDAE